MAELPDTSVDPTATRAASGARGTHWGGLRRAAVILALVAAALVPMLSFVPQHLARDLIATELDALNIEYEGIDTLEISPWTGTAWVGPIRFGAGSAQRAQLGELGLDIRFTPLLDRRVSIERLLLKGIDVFVTRGEDDVIALNGIPVDQVISPSHGSAQPEEGVAGWGAGADVLELRDSRLIFETRGGGVLEADIQRLSLMDFRTWEPDRPGRFELNATVNDIHLNWTGEVRPFADTMTVVIDSHTKQADIPKIVRFLGPLGLERQGGTYEAQLKYEMTVSELGRLEGRAVGVIDIDGLDYQAADVFALTIERAKLDLDIGFLLDESGDLQWQGQAALDFDRSNAVVPDGISVGADAGHFAVSELHARFATHGPFAVALKPNVKLEGVAFSGPIEISLDQVLQVLTLLQSLSAGTEVSPVDTGIGDYAGDSVSLPDSEINVDRLGASGDFFELKSADGQVELAMQVDTDLFGVQVVFGERTIRIKHLQSMLQRLKLTSGKGSLMLDMKGRHSLASGLSVSPVGELKLNTFESRLDSLALQVQTGAVSLAAAATAATSGVSGRINARDGLPQTQLRLGTAEASIGEVSIDKVGGGVRWQIAGSAAIDSLTAESGEGRDGAIKFDRAELTKFQANHRMEVVGDSLTVDGLKLDVKRSLLEGLTKGNNMSRATRPAGKTTICKPPSVTHAAAQPADVRQVQALLGQLGYAPGPVDGMMGKRTTAALEAFQSYEGLAVDGRSTTDVLVLLQQRTGAHGESIPWPSASAGTAPIVTTRSPRKTTEVSLSVPRSAAQPADVRQVQMLLGKLGYAPGPVDGKMGKRTATAIEAFRRDEGLDTGRRQTAELLAVLQRRAAAPAGRTQPPPASPNASQNAGSSVRLGELMLTGSPTIRFRDDNVTPEVNIDTVFKEARVRNLGVGIAEERTDVRLLAEINDSTTVELTGWFKGLTKSADLDLQTKVDNLNLSSYSPYFEQWVGVYLESGRLDTIATGKAVQGALQGEIQLVLDGVALKPMGVTDSERLAEKVGVPLGTAVSLLQDDMGLISLKLPVSGTLNQPEVDVSSVVTKAIGGVLKKVFPPTMIGSLLSGLLKDEGAAFTPIAFESGSAELDAEGKKYADDLVYLLTAHPKLAIKLCGRSTVRDAARLATSFRTARTEDVKKGSDPPPTGTTETNRVEQALTELAIERVRAVRRYLIEVESVDTKRVGECRSSFEPSDRGRPRVEIVL